MTAAHFFDQAHQQGHLVGVGGKEDGLPDTISCNFVGLDSDQFRFVHVFVGEFHDTL